MDSRDDFRLRAYGADKRIAELEKELAEAKAENAKLREAIDNALLCDTAVQMSEALQAALLGGE